MKLSAAILGTGFMAKTHCNCLKQIPNVEILGVCSRQQSRAGKFIAENEIPAQGFNDFDTMLETVKPDILYVCLPPAAHNGEVEKAAEKGVHLFLEKPIAINSTKAAAMVEAIEKNGVKSQVCFHLRFRKSVQQMKAMLDSGEAGRPTLFTGRFWVNMDGKEWWRDKAQSGGQIFEQAIHIYDLARFLFGDVKSVNGMIDNLCHQGREDYSIEDTNIGMLRFVNGAMGAITGSNCSVPMHFYADFRAVCEKAMLDYRCSGQTWVEADCSTIYRGEQEKTEFTEDDDVYMLANQDLIDAIRKDRNPLTPARDGLAAIEMVEAVAGCK